MTCFIVAIGFFILGILYGHAIARKTNKQLFEAMQRMDREKLAEALGLSSNADFLQRRKRP